MIGQAYFKCFCTRAGEMSVNANSENVFIYQLFSTLISELLLRVPALFGAALPFIHVERSLTPISVVLYCRAVEHLYFHIRSLDCRIGVYCDTKFTFSLSTF